MENIHVRTPGIRTNKMRKEHISIIISSETNASKKTSVMNLSRRSFTFLIGALVLIVIACVGFAISSAVNAAAYADDLKALQQQQL